MTDGRTDRAALINSSLETKKRLLFIAKLSPNLSFNWAEMVFNLDLPPTHPLYELIVLNTSFKGFPYPGKTSPEKFFWS